MAKTDLRVTIDAEAAKLEREIARTSKAMDRLAADIRRVDLEAAKLNKQLDEQQARAVEKLGRGMVAFGVAALAGLTLATKAAIDWESAWAGVRKTVEGSPEELAAVEAGLRGLATELPATHDQIAAVAEVAGQLGIATGDVVEFTRVMINLGETTNLSASEAATALARLMNVIGTAPADVERLGSTLVDLGNNAATTERDILEMAQRIAGTGAVIGLSEADVLAFATALSSVGIEAQAGGTAISRVMSEIASSVAAGGDAVSGFAEVAGMSASEFATAFETDPAHAIEAFVAGLGRINTSGGNVFKTLDDLSLGEIRVRDALLRLASAEGILTENLDRSSQAWEDNTALIEEAERRYDTAEAKIAIAKNTLVDLAIDIGNVLLPAVAGLAEGAADLLKWFGDLPGPIKTVLTILGGLVGVVATVGGGFLLLAPRLAAARAEMQLIRASAGPAAIGLRAVSVATKALGIAGLVVGGVLALDAALNAIAGTSKEVEVGTGQATKELLGLRDGVSSDLISKVVEANRVLEDTPDILGKVSLGFTTSSGTVRRASNDLKAGTELIDQALAGLVSGGNADMAAEIFDETARAWEASGGSVDELRNKLPGYADELARVDTQQQLTAESIAPIDDALVELANRFGLTGEDAEAAAQEMLDAWSEASTSFVDILGAYNDALAAKEEKERETAHATADATEDASDSWEDYVDDVTVSVDEYLAELQRQVDAQLNWQTNMLLLAGRVSAGTLDELARLGPEGAPLVAALVDASDEELAELETLMGARAEAGGQNFAQRLAEAEPILKRIANDLGQDVADSIAAGMAENGTTVQQEAERQGVNIDEGVGTNRTRIADVDVEVDRGSITNAEEALNIAARNRTSTISVRVAGGAGTMIGGITDRGHSGGMVTPGGIIPRLHNGGGFGLARDEVPAILQTRERVLSRAQNEAFQTLMNTLGQPVPVLPTAQSSASRGTDGGAFEGNLFLDSGEFMGVVRGSISQHDRDLKRRARAGTGLAR